MTIVYETDVGGPRVVQKLIQLPLRLLFLPSQPENQSSFSATIKCTDSLINLSQLFPGMLIFLTINLAIFQYN